jgi:ComF family protein
MALWWWLASTLVAHAAAWASGFRCAACGSTLDDDSVFCASDAAATLRARAPPAPPGVDAVIAFGIYGGPLADALKRYKYGQRVELARPLGALLLRALQEGGHEAAQRWDVIVPVPIHPRRLSQRGFNQAGLLASVVSRAVRLPALLRALARTRDTEPQAALAGAARRANMREAFTTRDMLAGRRVLLVDDVLTSGATAEGCASALRAAGVASVDLLVVATVE